MDKNEIEKLKFDLVNKDWTEELHLGLQEIDEEDARAIVESMDDEDINYNVNARRYQEDYIADYLEFLWKISEISFWKHVKATFDENVGLLWSDNMFYFEILCHERIPSDVLSKIISYVGSCDDEEKADLELLGCIIKEQVENFGRLPEIKTLISSLAEKQRYIAKKRTNEMINQQCNYL